MPRLIVAKEDGLVLLEVDLDPNKSYSLGRSGSASIRLEAPSISRLHAVLICKDGEWIISDLDSRQGTWGTDGRIESHRLRHGDWIAIGPAYLWFEGAGTCGSRQKERSEPAKNEDSRKKSMALLVEGPSPELPRIVVLEDRKPVTIGTSEGSDLRVESDKGRTIELGIFPHKNHWRIATLTDSKLLDDAGICTRSTPLAPKTPVFAGFLTLSLLPVESIGRQSELDDERMPELSDPPEVMGSIDLEALAKSGRTGKPDRPAAA